jgi:hypothetical protein
VITTILSSERFSRVTPFGVRFVDDQNGRVVNDGLSVSAWPTAQPSRVLTLPLNGTNVYYLLDAPGLRDLSYGAGDDAWWSSLPRRLGFTFEVEDTMARFLPFRFTASLPQRGLMRLACGAPPAPVELPEGAESDGVPLCTAPSRPGTPGSVILRAELWDADNDVPASWAVLSAITPGAASRGEQPARAVADYRGSVALHFPFPDERDFDGGSFDSPAAPDGAPLAGRTWTVQLSATYGHLPPDPLTLTRPTPPIPDLCAVLAQPAVKLWDKLGVTALSTVSMRFGQETLLASADPGSAPPPVVLLTT